MLVVETIAKIRRDHLVKGVPIKKLARDLRVSKNTIRKVVRGDATSHSYERKIQPMPKLGLWVEELERQLKANEKKARKDRLSLLRIHEDLVSLGYKGGYDAVRRYARAWRRRWRLLSPPQAYVPLIFDPGEAYQFDWSHEYARLSGATTRVKAAHMRLCHKRLALRALHLVLRHRLAEGDRCRLDRRSAERAGGRHGVPLERLLDRSKLVAGPAGDAFRIAAVAVELDHLLLGYARILVQVVNVLGDHA